MRYDTIFVIFIVVGFISFIIYANRHKGNSAVKISKSNVIQDEDKRLLNRKIIQRLYEDKICIKCKKNRKGGRADLLTENDFVLVSRLNFFVCNRCIYLRSPIFLSFSIMYVFFSLFFLIAIFEGIKREILLKDNLYEIFSIFGWNDLKYVGIWILIGIIIYMSKDNSYHSRQKVAYSVVAKNMRVDKSPPGKITVVLQNKKGYAVDRTIVG